jgi:hypothetical protein
MNPFVLLSLIFLAFIPVDLAEGASIEIVGQSGTSSLVVELGETFEIKIVVDLDSMWSDGVEIYIGYDPDMLSPVDVDPSTSRIEPFIRGELFSGVELANFAEGRIIGYCIGVLPNYGSPATGQGIVAVARFKPLRVGTTKLTFKSSQEDWRRGRYTLLTLSKTGRRGSFKARSFASLKDAEIQVFRSIPFILIPPPDMVLLEDSEGIFDLKALVKWRDVERPIRWLCSAEEITARIEPDHTLHVKPLPNWKGETDILITAQLEGAPTQAATLHVVVRPDPSDPVIKELPEIRFRAKSERYALNVDYYVQDSDTPVREIKWHIEGNLMVQASFDEERRKLILFCPRDWQGEEIITVVAEDPEGNFDLKEVKVTVLPPERFEFELKQLDEITLQEGDPPRSVLLDTYILKTSFDSKRLRWEVRGNAKVKVNISGRIATFIPKPGWTGSEILTFKASAPDGTAREMKLKVSVLPKPMAEGEFKIAVIRNPIFRKRIDLLILTPPGLDPKTLSVSAYIDGDPIEVDSMQNDMDVWLGQISLPETATGKLKVKVSAQNVSGLRFKEGVKEVDLR